MRRAARGSALTENIITVALIAIATIGIIALYGNNTRALFSMSADSLAGANSVKNTASHPGRVEKTMKTFATGNAGGVSNGGGGMSPNSKN